MATDTIGFIITWEGATKAQLFFIEDNKRVVATLADNLVGTGVIRHTYTTTKAAVHLVEWSLWFPGRAARKFAAKVAVNGGLPVTLDVKKDESKNKWASRGAAP